MLYDYWFVQFDFPDEDGKPYRASGGKMVWNERLKREIPDEWAVLTLSDLVQHINTGLNPRQNFKLGNGSIRYVTVKNLGKDGSIDYSSCDVIDEAARAKVHARSDISTGDVLFASIAPLGRCHVIMEEPQDWDINESVFSIRPSSLSTPEYLYGFLTSEHFVHGATNQSTGSIFKGIRINDLLDTDVILPDRRTLEGYSIKARMILNAQHATSKESIVLQELRDWLLPMLMNGQATVEATQPNATQPNYRLSNRINAHQRNVRFLKAADPMANGQSTIMATSQLAGQGRVQVLKQSRQRRFFQSSLLRIPYGLRECKTIKPLATIHFAKQAPKRKISRFIIHLRRFRAPKPARFCPWDKNETVGSRFRNGLRICPRICPERLREITRRDSVAWRPKPTTKL